MDLDTGRHTAKSLEDEPHLTTIYQAQPQPLPFLLHKERNSEERERESSAAAMANSGMMTKKEIGESHDVLRFGVNDSVKGDLAPPHPLQATIHSVTADPPLPSLSDLSPLVPSETLTPLNPCC